MTAPNFFQRPARTRVVSICGVAGLAVAMGNAEPPRKA
jgi:hypothetical protein